MVEEVVEVGTESTAPIFNQSGEDARAEQFSQLCHLLTQKKLKQNQSHNLKNKQQLYC
jgi:hypothetical protein